MRVSRRILVTCPTCSGQMRACLCHNDREVFLGFDDDGCQTLYCEVDPSHVFRIKYEHETGTHAEGRLMEGAEWGCTGRQCPDPESER